MDAAVVLAGELVVVQAGAAVEHAQADAGAGQAACVGHIGVDRLQAPVAVEFGGAPAGGITRRRMMGSGSTSTSAAATASDGEAVRTGAANAACRLRWNW
jgi:hypothetical protein